MHKTLNLEDIFNLMIELETLGNKHYVEMQLLTSDQKLKELFGLLAIQEVAHKKTYVKYKKMNIALNAHGLDPAYVQYMDALLKGTLSFLAESKEIKDFSHGFRIAVQLEKDTILFLTELRKIIDPAYLEAIDKITDQERTHLQYLYNYLEKR